MREHTHDLRTPTRNRRRSLAWDSIDESEPFSFVSVINQNGSWKYIFKKATQREDDKYYSLAAGDRNNTSSELNEYTGAVTEQGGLIWWPAFAASTEANNAVTDLKVSNSSIRNFEEMDIGKYDSSKGPVVPSLIGVLTLPKLELFLAPCVPRDGIQDKPPTPSWVAGQKEQIHRHKINGDYVPDPLDINRENRKRSAAGRFMMEGRMVMPILDSRGNTAFSGQNSLANYAQWDITDSYVERAVQELGVDIN